VLVHHVIVSELDVFVCEVQYVNVKLENVYVLELYVALVIVLVFGTQLLQLI
jgi:hypothetical protein